MSQVVEIYDEAQLIVSVDEPKIDMIYINYCSGQNRYNAQKHMKEINMLLGSRETSKPNLQKQD